MPLLRTLGPSICLLALMSAAQPAAAQVFDGMYQLMHGGALHEEESRFLPGRYYFRKGNEYRQRGQSAMAVDLWTRAAGWAMKDAQYNLGISYFKGEGMSADRPRGLAWLALAAERKDAAFNESLAAAWDESTPLEREQANAIWRQLRERYADSVALPLARRRFDAEMAQITGSRVGMPGHVHILAQGGDFDVAVYKKQLDQAAGLDFGRLPRGRVDIGPVQTLTDPPPPPGRDNPPS
jgi:TPR repeat protein